MQIKSSLLYKTKFKEPPSVLSCAEIACPESKDKFEFSSEKREKEWTLLFYNAGYGKEAKMCTSSLIDLEKIGSDENTSVVVLNYRSSDLLGKVSKTIEKFNGGKTYYVTRNENPPEKLPLLSGMLPAEARRFTDYLLSSPKDINSPVIEEHSKDINMADKETLRTFLIDNMKKYPARHYAVIISGEGNHLEGVIKGPKGSMKNEDLAEVLESVVKETGRKIDLLDLNTSRSANIESLYPLKDSVETVVASENYVSGGTQPFSKVLSDLQKGLEEGREISGRELATLLVEEARRQPLGNLYLENLSAFDMEKIGNLVDSIKELQKTLMAEGVEPGAIKKAIESSVKVDYSRNLKNKSLVDAGSFAEEIVKYTDSARVRDEAEKLKKALKECIIDEQHTGHVMHSIAGKALGMFFRGERDIRGLTGLTVYYDTDVNSYDSKVKELEKTEYAGYVEPEAFLKYLSLAAEEEKANRSGFKKSIDGLKEKHRELKKKVSEKTGVPEVLIDLGEKGAKVAGLVTGLTLLKYAGIPASALYFGPLLSVKGSVNTYKNVKNTAELSQKEKFDVIDKNKMIDYAGDIGLGMAIGTIGLSHLGLLPKYVVLPALIAGLSIKGGKEITKMLMGRKEAKDFEKETEKFDKMSTGEKLGYVSLQEN